VAKIGPDRGSPSRAILPEARPNSNARRRRFADRGKNYGHSAKASCGELRQNRRYGDFARTGVTGKSYLSQPLTFRTQSSNAAAWRAGAIKVPRAMTIGAGEGEDAPVLDEVEGDR